MQSISKFGKGCRFLLCVIDIYSKYAWVIPLKYKKRNYDYWKTVLDKSNCKPNKLLVEKVGKFYIRSMKLWLEKINIETYSTHNEGKSVIAEKFIRSLKIKSINTWLQFQKMFILIN